MVSFRDQLRAGELLAGTWIKTPHPHVVEVLSLSSLDCLVLDAEHAPFDRAALDLCILAARAGGKTVLVRPQSASHEHILNALDCGADGVILPHICNAADAEDAVKACHYISGGRGYAGSSRAAGYTTKGMAKHRADAASVTIIAQIEDVEGVENIEAIAAVDGIDALFIGRADLTISYAAQTPDDTIVVDAVDRIVAAGKKAGRMTGMFLGRTSDVAMWREKGASLFILGSDQDFLLQGAAKLAEAVKA
ncbi:HpcH/HpaI aldolase/citrate lyase family protein [Sphingorhabdus sp.]|jgi:2-keto-3-deoxy-L-rhamnonate aldolase RhmA|uniref:HpcH/HpaI aldolase/citrate lyase family protein n=1 Tax=Sphingorhabdus sp. TaxID=1902408 RepID=UPI0037CB644C